MCIEAVFDANRGKGGWLPGVYTWLLAKEIRSSILRIARMKPARTVIVPARRRKPLTSPGEIIMTVCEPKRAWEKPARRKKGGRGRPRR